MNKFLLSVFFTATFFLSGCSILPPKMPEEVRNRINSIPKLDVDNLENEDALIHDLKKKALLKYLSGIGYDPLYIGNYHIDLGCNLFLEKLTPYRKTDIIEHKEFFILRDYSRQLKGLNLINSDFCDPLKFKLISSVDKEGFFSNRLYTINFKPSENKDNWDINIKPGRFVSVDIIKNLGGDGLKNVALRGEEDKDAHFIIYGCSMYGLPKPYKDKDSGKIKYRYEIYQPKVEVDYLGDMDYYLKRNLASSVLRESEHWVNCQDRVIFNKIDNL